MKLKKRHKRTLIVLSILFAVLGIFKYKLEHEVEMIPEIDGEKSNYILELTVTSGGGVGVDGNKLPVYRYRKQYYIKDGDTFYEPGFLGGIWELNAVAYEDFDLKQILKINSITDKCVIVADNNEINVEFNKSYHIKSNHSNVVVYDGSSADSYIIEIKQIE